jgi:2-aminoadipate transaminase
MEYSFSKSLDALKSSAVREILKLTQGSSVISFSGGLPAEEFFPVAEMKEAFNRVFSQEKKALQYGLTDGYIPLREWIIGRMKQKNMHVGLDNMILTTGSQQVLDLLSRVYLDPGDCVLMENPSYLAAIQLFQSRGVRMIGVEADADGMDLDDLQAKIAAHRPKMVYVVPTFSNPTGKAWSLERRLGLLRICRENNVLILEDDPYGELRFDDSSASYPTIFSLDEHPNGSAVVYTSTFSKIVAPAVRTGWAMGDVNIIQAMVRAKQAVDLHSSSLDQMGLYELLAHFDLDSHIAKIRKEYRERKEMMHHLLTQQGWEDITWNAPKGGMFFWVELPEDVDAEQLLPYAVKEGVAFVPGAPFYVDTPKRNTLRINFTHADRETMMLGVERFARAVNAYCGQAVR